MRKNDSEAVRIIMEINLKSVVATIMEVREELAPQIVIRSLNNRRVYSIYKHYELFIMLFNLVGFW